MTVARLRGGLGNQMFQYAAGKARAVSAKTKLALDHSWFTSPGALRPRREYQLDVFAIPNARKASWLATRIAKLTGQYLDGFFQNETHFKSIEKEIRADFTFAQPIQDSAKSLVTELSQSNTVCVHVRRTDFVTAGMWIGTEYYQTAAEEILRRFPHAAFFVFSDDIEWCRTNLTFLPRATFVGEEYAGYKHAHYLQLMTKCNHFIIPNSTFAWWAAWLSVRGGKTVIAPKLWRTGPKTTSSDIVPPGWIVIE
ncbi:MAG TPA: alpha-1,2-fucosyltransferase [Candidatus Paceibacterota bacterium]